MAEDFDDHRRIFDRCPEPVEGAAMIFKASPQFGQRSMSMSIFPELTQYWNRIQIGTANLIEIGRVRWGFTASAAW
jgi:hypothetical protein